MPRVALPLFFSLLACGALDCGGTRATPDRAPEPPSPEPTPAPAAEPAAILALTLAEPSHEAPAGAPHALVRVPEGFRRDQPWVLVLFLHGWNGCVNVLMRAGPTRCVAGTGDPQEGWGLAGVFDDAQRNALFVMPQLAFRRRDGDAGRFAEPPFARRFLDALAAEVGPWPEHPPERVVLTAHSAGFETALAWIGQGEVSVDEVVLFDALYAGTEAFARWAMEGDRRLVSIHTGRGGTARQSGRLRRMATIAEREVGSALASPAPFVVHQSDVPHRAVPHAHLAAAIRGAASQDDSTGENQ